MSPNSTRTCLTVILAAGEGKRMASSVPKVVHPVAGLPMVCHVIDTAVQSGGTHHAIVVGNQAELVANIVKNHTDSATIHEQKERNGTAHAVLAARNAVTNSYDDVVVLYGDVPLIHADTITAARTALQDGADIVVLGFETGDPSGYGRLLVSSGELIAIREHKDATDQEREVTFCNSGIMAFRRECILDVLDGIRNENAQGEFYLTDAVEVGRSKGLSVIAITVPEEDTLGVNDRVQLAEVESIWQRRQRNRLLRAGVTMTAPHTIQFHHDTVIEADVTLEANIVFAAGVTVRSGATIRAFSHLEGATVGEGAIVGPYARLRPGTEMGRGSKAGNFVETKNAKIGAGAKINHLSYIGDAEVGKKANIGAGTITCNYDGFNKHRTNIGDGVFIGSNTSLVAPVNIGKNANTAAGSVISQNVLENDLAIERSQQVNLTGKAQMLRERYAAAKATKS